MSIRRKDHSNKVSTFQETLILQDAVTQVIKELFGKKIAHEIFPSMADFLNVSKDELRTNPKLIEKALTEMFGLPTAQLTMEKISTKIKETKSQ